MKKMDDKIRSFNFYYLLVSLIVLALLLVGFLYAAPETYTYNSYDYLLLHSYESKREESPGGYFDALDKYNEAFDKRIDELEKNRLENAKTDNERKEVNSYVAGLRKIGPEAREVMYNNDLLRIGNYKLRRAFLVKVAIVTIIILMVLYVIITKNFFEKKSKKKSK